MRRERESLGRMISCQIFQIAEPVRQKKTDVVMLTGKEKMN